MKSDFNYDSTIWDAKLDDFASDNTNCAPGHEEG